MASVQVREILLSTVDQARKERAGTMYKDVQTCTKCDGRCTSMKDLPEECMAVIFFFLQSIAGLLTLLLMWTRWLFLLKQHHPGLETFSSVPLAANIFNNWK